MATNLDVQRLSTKDSAAVPFTVPPIPDIPESVLRRIPELRTWMQEMQEWRERFQRILKAQLDNLSKP